MNIPRKITIEPVLNGYLCRVGCQTLVFTSMDGMINELREYLVDPDAKEKAMAKSALHKDMLRNPVLRSEPHQQECCSAQQEGRDPEPNPYATQPAPRTFTEPLPGLSLGAIQGVQAADVSLLTPKEPPLTSPQPVSDSF